MATQPTTARDKVRTFTPKLIELTENVLFGDVWERPELSKRDRSLITVATLIALNRSEHWQCGYVIPKGRLDEIRSRGLDAFRADVARLLPVAQDHVAEIRNWDDVKLLTVKVDRLQRWSRPGLLCIGDAAHAMSPVGGVGINLAIQDAVAAANLLAAPLREGRLTVDHLEQVASRRLWPTRATQELQLAIQRRVVRPVLDSSGTLHPPPLVRLLTAIPQFRRLAARLVGMGVRPEHVRV